jgi:uncharacterized repeat protein (TIGR02543 family)
VPTPPTGDTPSQDDPGDTPAPVTFSVTFDSKGGTAIEGYDNVEFGQTVSAPKYNPTKLGYEFNGWTLSNGDAVDFDAYTVYSNVTFYASWKAKSYDLTAYLTDEKVAENIIGFASNSVAEHYGDNVSIVNGDKYALRDTTMGGVTVKTLTFSLSYESTSNSGQSLPVPTTTKDGDRFMYWYYYEGDTIVPLTKTLAKGSTAQTIELIKGYKFDGARTLYAMWYSALENITVKFNSGMDGHSISTPDVVVKDGDYLEAPANPAIDGYDFDKWTYFDTKDGKYVLDDKDNKVSKDMTFYTTPASQGVQITKGISIDGVFNLYANWTKRVEINSASDWTSLDDSDAEVQNANIYLKANITITGNVTKFVGDNAFKGVFDGGGHIITYTTTNDASHVALVGNNNGTIKSLIVSATINIADGTQSTYYIGAVAGVSSGVVSAVEVSTFNLAISTHGDVHAGGILAVNEGEVSGSKCAVVAMTVEGKDLYCGGVMGLSKSGFVTGVSINGTNAILIDANGQNAYVGAIAGKISAGKITKCSVAGATLNATATSSAFAGGASGKILNNTIEEFALVGATITAQGRNAYAGGVVGEGGSSLRHVMLSDVAVNADGTMAVAGGFVGANFCESGNRGQIQYSVLKGSVSATSANGKAYAGGIAGQQNAGASSSNGAVAYVYAEVNVSATGTDGNCKLGKAFGVHDTKTVCANVYVSKNTSLSLNGVEYDSENKNFAVTERVDVDEIVPSQETIQNASWINTKLKLNASSPQSSPVWIVTDGTYPTLAFVA